MTKFLALLFILAAMSASAVPLLDQTPAQPTQANVGVPRRRGTTPKRPKKSMKSKADEGLSPNVPAEQMPVVDKAPATKRTAARMNNKQPRENKATFTGLAPAATKVEEPGLKGLEAGKKPGKKRRK